MTADTLSVPTIPATRTRGVNWLAVVAAAYLLIQVIVAVPGVGLSFDESVYASQISSHAPAAFFNAPRARGISWLVAPITSWTAHVWVLRLYLAVLSAGALYVVFRLWRPLRDERVLALAAALFAGLWITLFYGPAAMPNLWVAFGALAAVGSFLRAVRDPSDRVALAILAGAVVLAALMRPSDAIWLCAPLLVAVVVWPAWRRWRVAAVIVGALIVGIAPWVVEAYVRFGGPLARLHRSGQIEGGFGLHFAFLDQLKSQTGRLLCRPCTLAWHHQILSAWLIVLPLLAVASLVVAARSGDASTTVLPLVCAASLAVPYIILIDYAASRFLLPVYALLAIPVADVLVAVVRGVRPINRPLVVLLVGVVLAGHFAMQFGVFWHTARAQAAATAEQGHIAATLSQHGVRPPCIIDGDQAIPIAYLAGCLSAAESGNNANLTAREILQAARHEPVGVVVHAGFAPPAYAALWPHRTIPGLSHYAGERTYLSPR